MINLTHLAYKISEVLVPATAPLTELLQGITAEQRRTNDLLEVLVAGQESSPSPRVHEAARRILLHPVSSTYDANGGVE